MYIDTKLLTTVRYWVLFS